MTFPPCFPLPSNAFFAPVRQTAQMGSLHPQQEQQEVSLKPRLSAEDEEGALALLDMSKICSKELHVLQERRQQDGGDAMNIQDTSSTSSLEEDSASNQEDSRVAREGTAWNSVRTVSIDEDHHPRVPPVDFVELKSHSLNMMNNNSESLYHTPVSYNNNRNPFLYRPVVITPNISMKRPIISFSTPQAQVKQPLLLDAQRLQQQPLFDALRTAFASMEGAAPATPLNHAQQSFPKLPPLLSMKRDKRLRKSSEDSIFESSTQPQQETASAGDVSPLPSSENKKTVKRSPSSSPKRVRKTKTPPATASSSSSSPIPTMRKHGGGKKFSWKNYPELEDFLIANRPEYLKHSAQNYTLEQKDYNNTLTARLIDYAEACGYGNLLERPEYAQDFGSFTAVRDRIRGYYKSFLQSSRRREQRRQRRLEKLRLQQRAAMAA